MLAVLPDPGTAQSIGWLCLAVFGIAGGANQVVKLWRTARGEANTDDIARRVHKLEEDMIGGMELNRRLQGIELQITDASEKRETMQSEISDMAGTVGSLKTATDFLNQMLSNLNAHVSGLNRRLDERRPR